MHSHCDIAIFPTKLFFNYVGSTGHISRQCTLQNMKEKFGELLSILKKKHNKFTTNIWPLVSLSKINYIYISFHCLHIFQYWFSFPFLVCVCFFYFTFTCVFVYLCVCVCICCIYVCVIVLKLP